MKAGRMGWSFAVRAVALLVGACHAFSTASGGQAFTFAAGDARSWLPKPGAPVPTAHPSGGVAFRVPFSSGADRVCWDREVALNLKNASGVDLDLSCDQPVAVRSVGLYLKSGDGWYVAGKPLDQHGRQTLHMQKSDFKEEGRPVGWHAINSIRLSPWRGEKKDAQLVVHGVRPVSSRVALVRGTLSAPTADDRALAGRVTDRLGAWLSATGIPFKTITDNEVIADGLTNMRVAILGYNPRPPTQQVQALTRFMASGGRLIVCYSSSGELAGAMRMRLGAYMRAQQPGQWASYSFAKPGEWLAPARVYQQASSLVPAWPADSSAQVLAWWADAGEQTVKIPAWTASPGGVWASHILSSDDAVAQQAALRGLVVTLDPSAGYAAAQHAVRQAGQVDSFHDFNDACHRLSAAATKDADQAMVARSLRWAGVSYEAMHAAFSAGRYGESLLKADEVRRHLTDAYARVQAPRNGEFRGVWDHTGLGLYPGQWDRTCQLLAAHGVHAVFPNMIWGGMTHFPSAVLPASASVRVYGDQLAACMQAARRHGLQVHVWKVCWKLEGAPSEFIARMRAENRLQMDANGRVQPWLCPSDPRNVQMAVASIVEAARYGVDGIHLDYVRYPDSNSCYAPATRHAFEARQGKAVVGWPRDVRPGGKLYAAYQRFRADEITAFVGVVRRALKAVNPQARLSAAVFGGYPGCMTSMGQDWPVWVKQGWVDFVCPMNYVPDVGSFARLLEQQVQLVGRECLLPGMGVTASECQLSPDRLIEQILVARRLGVSGYILFQLNGTLARDTLPALRMGITSN